MERYSLDFIKTRVKIMHVFNIYGNIYEFILFLSILLIQEKYDQLLMNTASSFGCGDNGGGGDGVAVFEPSVNSMALWVKAAGGMK